MTNTGLFTTGASSIRNEQEEPLTRRAQILENDGLEQLERYIDLNATHPIRDRLIVALTFKAGLRVGEVTKLRVSDLTDARGAPLKTITLFEHVTKGGRERQLPMHDHVRAALIAFMRSYPKAKYVAFSSRRGRIRVLPPTSNALCSRLSTLYRNAGFVGVTSHSGRRSFATKAARNAGKHGATLVDVQRMLGHQSLATTECYVEPAPDLFALMNSL